MQYFINNTALICEGGGMRAAVTGGMASVLIERGVVFPYITGVSAGTFIGASHFLRGHGYFNSHYIYEESFFDDDLAQHSWQTFCDSDIEIALSAFNAETGQIRYWNKADITSYGDLCRICRASSSLPVVMPSTYIDGQPYIDGGVHEGFVLEPAIAAGIERFVILPTHVRGFRREVKKNNAATRVLYRNYPKVLAAMETRAANYNRQMDLIDELEASGRALVLYPDEMPIERTEHDKEKLEAAWQQGRAQAEQACDAWLAWMTAKL